VCATFVVKWQPAQTGMMSVTCIWGPPGYAPADPASSISDIIALAVSTIDTVARFAMR
jgi:hypothetical protein